MLIRRATVLGVFVTSVWALPTIAQTHDDALIARALEPWTGDLDGIVERRMLRIATAHNPLFFAYDGDRSIGMVVDAVDEFEDYLRDKLDAKIDVIIMPFPRDQIIPAVVDGKADIAAANLTITSERAEFVSFTDPIHQDIAEVVVTGPGTPTIESFDDLKSTGLYLRPSSSYYGHLQALNDKRRANGDVAIPVIKGDERLEDHDLLDIVSAGIIPAIVVDSHKAALWAQVFDDITVHADLAINEGGEIAWAVRKDNPKLLAITNDFVATIKEGTLLGNILINRYLGSTDWIKSLREREAHEDYEAIIETIRSYADDYEFDWLMILAQAYQESKLDQSKVSNSGAVGVMQILPSTASDPNVGIENIKKLDNNVHAGVKYLHFIRERYFDDPAISDLDRMLLSFAAYNAGPANVARARKKAEEMGLDPNVWFGNVETAAARVISREPVNYVRNIYKYFVSYRLARDLLDQREQAVEEIANIDWVPRDDQEGSKGPLFGLLRTLFPGWAGQPQSE